MGSKLLKLEALRGFAALYVVLHHTVDFTYYFLGVNLGELLRFGQEAVILFFLISGFVINYSFRNSTDQSFRNFFLKRFIRLYVPLLVVFGIGYLTESYNAGAWIAADLQKFFLNLLMLQDWDFAKPNVIVAPLLNNDPLWSLSYEWWFYMLFYPLARYIPDGDKQSAVVFSLSVLASFVYLLYPTFIPRLLMYMSIWWVGVYLSNAHIDKGSVTMKDCRLPLLVLAVISCVLSLGVYIKAAAGEVLLLGAHPVLELRHSLFALLVVLGAFVWQRYQWRFFNVLFGPFLFLAPISYTIYISHYHLMSSATYLSFIGQPVVEWFAYLGILLVFSWWLELVFYIRVRNWLYPKLRRPRAGKSKDYQRA